jgi:hypothetical protein
LRLVFSIFNFRNYFGSNKKTKQQDLRYSSSQQQNSRKIFEKTEGEYVDFEEVTEIKTPKSPEKGLLKNIIIQN